MTGHMSRVKVLSRLTTVSSRAVESGKTHPFTALDHAMGLHSLHVIFYYKVNVFEDFDLDSRRVSLSHALSLYPPVTGRVTRNGEGNWEVNCNDAGVRIVRTRVGSSLDEWLRSADGVEEKDLTVWDDMPEDPTNWSPFRIQVNEFEGGGTAIGLSCTHMHADPTCATLLYKSWTDTHRNGAVSHPPVFSAPSVRARPDPIIKTASSSSYYAAKSCARASPTASSKMATATFIFRHVTIQERLAESCANATPFDLLAALFWTRVARAKGERGNNHYGHSLSICTDARGVPSSDLPLGHYGNALHFSLLWLEEIDGRDLSHVVGEIHRHVAGITGEEIRSGFEWLESRKGEGGRYGPALRMYGPELTCVSLEHLVGPSGPNGSGRGPLMYGAGFGEGAYPVHVSYHVGHVEGEGLVMVAPGAEGGLARAVTVTLPESELNHLRADPAILGLEPTMILSGKVLTLT